MHAPDSRRGKTPQPPQKFSQNISEFKNSKFQYKIGQLYMIAKHSAEQSQKGEGVEVVENRPHEDPEHGKGQFTEKRIYISSKLPSWIRKMVPKIFYVTEKAWNYYPFTITEYSVCIPRFL